MTGAGGRPGSDDARAGVTPPATAPMAAVIAMIALLAVTTLPLRNLHRRHSGFTSCRRARLRPGRGLSQRQLASLHWPGEPGAGAVGRYPPEPAAFQDQAGLTGSMRNRRAA